MPWRTPTSVASCFFVRSSRSDADEEDDDDDDDNEEDYEDYEQEKLRSNDTTQ